MQIYEACLVSLITSLISFGLPLLRKCTPCPEYDPKSGIECPRAPGMYGNYVNVRSAMLIVSLSKTQKIFLKLWILYYFLCCFCCCLLSWTCVQFPFMKFLFAQTPRGWLSGESLGPSASWSIRSKIRFPLNATNSLGSHRAKGPRFTLFMWRERFVWVPWISWDKVSDATVN